MVGATLIPVSYTHLDVYKRQINDRSLKTCMNYCITLVQGERDSLKKEILKEISQLQKATAKKVDSKKIKKKIDNLEMKKRKAIDLMLDGVISKEDLQNQTEWYNEELEKLNIQLSDALQKDKSDSRQVNNMEQYVKALDEMIELDGNSEDVYKEVLEMCIRDSGYRLERLLRLDAGKNR